MSSAHTLPPLPTLPLPPSFPPVPILPLHPSLPFPLPLLPSLPPPSPPIEEGVRGSSPGKF